MQAALKDSRGRIKLLAGYALKSFHFLRVGKFEGKVHCPAEGCNTAIKVMDGAEHQKSDYAKPIPVARAQQDLGSSSAQESNAFLQKRARKSGDFKARLQLESEVVTVEKIVDALTAGELHEQASPWQLLVQNLEEEGGVRVRTTKGMPAVGSPAPGGFLAYEVNMTPFALEEIELSEYGPSALPSALRSACTAHRRSLVFMPIGARSDEHFTGDHLKKSNLYNADNSLKCEFASHELTGLYASFFQSCIELQGYAEKGFKGDGSAEHVLRRLWSAFVHHVDTANAVLEVDDPNTGKATVAAGRHKTGKAKPRSKGDPKSAEGKPRCCEYKLPASPPSHGSLKAFFKIMTSRIFEGDGSDEGHPDLGKHARKTDYGPFKALCACGLTITQSHKHISHHEDRVDAGDVCFGIANHPTNRIFYDFNCESGFAGHLPNRFPILQPLLSSVDSNGVSDDRMGGAVPPSQVWRWYTNKASRKPILLPWLSNACLKWQTGKEYGALSCRLNVCVMLHLFYPRFSNGNVQTGESVMYLSIDNLHAQESQHPLWKCGRFLPEMIVMGGPSMISTSWKDFAAAERAWIEARLGNGFMSRLSPGMKILWQHVLDQERCRKKVYGDGRTGGRLFFMMLEAAKYTNVLPAYDSLSRLRFACVVCGSIASTCAHTGTEDVQRAEVISAGLSSCRPAGRSITPLLWALCTCCVSPSPEESTSTTPAHHAQSRARTSFPTETTAPRATVLPSRQRVRIGYVSASALQQQLLHVHLQLSPHPVEDKGDCFPLSALVAVNLLDAADVAHVHPDTDTAKMVLLHRMGAVRLLVRAARDTPFDLGDDSDDIAIREALRFERVDCMGDVEELLTPWATMRHWQTNTPTLSSAFMFAFALAIQTPIFVFEYVHSKLVYVDTVKVYGLREKRDAQLLGLPATADHPDSPVPFFNTRSSRQAIQVRARTQLARVCSPTCPPVCSPPCYLSALVLAGIERLRRERSCFALR